MKTFIIILSFGALLFSCSKTEHQKTQGAKSDSAVAKNHFAVDSLKVQDSLQVAKTLTLSFEKQILLFPDITNKIILDSIYQSANISAADYSKKSLAGILEKVKTESLKKGDAQEYMPEFKQTWDEVSGMKIISHQNDILTLQYAGSGYSGGAHGYYYENYKAFDLKRNVVINQNDVLINAKDPAWDKILKSHFEQPEQKEMLLENNILPNNNFYFDDNKITFVYNQYEITAYAAGVVYISINFSEIRNLLKPAFVNQYKIN